MFPPVVPNWLKSALMTLHSIHVYDNDVFIDHTHWQSKNKKVARTAFVSVECEEPFASKASRQGKILTISSPRAFLILQSFEVVRWG